MADFLRKQQNKVAHKSGPWLEIEHNIYLLEKDIENIKKAHKDEC